VVPDPHLPYRYTKILKETNQSYRYLPENRLSCRFQQIGAARPPSGLVHSRKMGHREAAIFQIH
jgi:hypothetical protein